jgi:adenylate cyclase class 2
MQIEYEATFININKDEVRQRLITAGAQLIRPEFLQRRVILDLPAEKRGIDRWLRVRDEGDKITMSLKIIDGDQIENQHELCLVVSNMDEAVELLTTIGCQPKAYQETKRELWRLDDVEITIDQWPYLEPFVEVEGLSEKAVQDISHRIGFDYSQALFCAVDRLYQLKYGIDKDLINYRLPRLVFDEPNPFDV